MSDSPRPSEMSLSIKLGEHAVDVSGPVHEVWKVLEVFQRLSGFDPREAEREYVRRRQAEEMMQMQQAMLQQQQYIPFVNAPPQTSYGYTAPATNVAGTAQLIPVGGVYSELKKLLGKGEKPGSEKP